MKKKKKKEKRATDESGGSFGLSFGDLLKESGLEVKQETPKAKKAPAPALPVKEERKSADDWDFSDMGKVVVRRETKRRGGKAVTVVRGLELRPDELMFLAQELRKLFGCGASIEDDDLLLQGDQRQRIEEWLVAHGAKKVILG